MMSGSRAVPIAISAAALVLFVVLVAGNIASTSPTSDETTHLAGGWSYLAWDDYRLNTEHPPLLKKLAALPVRMLDVWPRDATDDGNPRLFSVLRESWEISASRPMAQWFFAQHLFYGVRDEVTQRNGWSPLSVPTTAALGRDDFVNDADAIFQRARSAMILPGILLAIVIFLWSRELWGYWGAAISVTLFCADPNFVAHTGLVTTDVGASLFFLAAVWFFWRALHRPSSGVATPPPAPSKKKVPKGQGGAGVKERGPKVRGDAGVTQKLHWPSALAFALCFALAQVSKFSGVLLLPILFVLAVHARRQLRQVALMIAMAGVVSVVTIWAVYDFRHSAFADVDAQIASETAVLSALQDRRLASPGRYPTGRLATRATLEEAAALKALASRHETEPPFDEVRRAMQTTPLPFSAKTILFFNEHKLLPEAYLDGLASVGLGGVFRNTYLNGEYGSKGFRSYFLWTFLFKTPIPLMLLLLAGVWLGVKKHAAWLPFLLWPAAIYLVVAMSSAINIGHRHILPVFPFLYVLCGSLAERLTLKRGVIAAALLVIPLFVVLPNAPMWGHHLSYMNELAGGPRNGWKKLVDSNLDWGQDLPALSQWLQENGVKEPVTFLYFGTAEPQYYGIRYVNPPLGFFARPDVPLATVAPTGYFAASVNSYNGFFFTPDSRDLWRNFLEKHGAKKVGSAGYSIFIYKFP